MPSSSRFFVGVVDLQLVNLAAEVREQGGILAAVVERRARDDTARQSPSTGSNENDVGTIPRRAASFMTAFSCW